MNACLRIAVISGVLIAAGFPKNGAAASREASTHGHIFVVAVGSADISGPADLQERMRVATKIVDGRLDDTGVDYYLTHEPEGRVIVKVPVLAAAELEKVRRAVSRFGLIQFRLVHPTMVKGELGPDEVAPGYEELIFEITREGQDVEERLWVKRLPELTGVAIKRARWLRDRYDYVMITVELTSEGGERFRQITHDITERARQGGPPERLAIVVDGAVITAPVVSAEIGGGTLQISGSFTERDALELCSLLNNPVDFSIRLVEERTF